MAQTNAALRTFGLASCLLFLTLVEIPVADVFNELLVYIFPLCFAPSLFVLALLDSHAAGLPALRSELAAPFAFAVSAGLGSIAFMGAEANIALAGVLYAVSAVTFGGAVGISLAFWLSRFDAPADEGAREPLWPIAVASIVECGAHALLIYGGVGFIPSVVSASTVCLVTMLIQAWAEVHGCAVPAHEGPAVSEVGSVALAVARGSWRFALCLAFLQIAFGMMQSALAGKLEGGYRGGYAQIAGFALASFLVLSALAERRVASFLRRDEVLLTLCGLTVAIYAVLPFVWETALVPLVCATDVPYAIVLLLVYDRIREMQAERIAPPLAACGYVLGSAYLLSGIGLVTGHALAAGLGTNVSWFLASALVVALLMLGLMVVSEIIGRARDTVAPIPGASMEEDALPDYPELRAPSALRTRFGVTQREEEVLALVLSGHTAKDISLRLMVSENTVKTHLRRSYSKMGVHSRAEARALIEELSS